MVYRAPTLCLFVSGAADVSQSAIVSLLLFPLLCWLYNVLRSPSDILSMRPSPGPQSLEDVNFSTSKCNPFLALLAMASSSATGDSFGESGWASARASESDLNVVNRPRAGGNLDEDSSDEDETIFTTAQPEAEMLLSKSSCVECGALRLRRSDMAGMLARADERVLRWHVLEGTRLLSFAPSTTQPRGVISLSGTTVGVEDERTLLLVVATPLASRCYTLRAPDADEQARWLRALRRREGLKLGWLEKRGALNTSFKRRWCQLDAAGERLLYYAAPSEAIECVGLTNLTSMEAAPSSVAGGCR